MWGQCVLLKFYSTDLKTNGKYKFPSKYAQNEG